MANYKGVLTNNGKALFANASINSKVNFSHIALGDGNGSVPSPDENRSSLVAEKTRIALNAVGINPNNSNQVVCEAIIPSNIGGFTIRELGLYAGNILVVNSNYPATYKPNADEGTARELNIKMVVNVQNADVTAVYLDDSLIYATREWVKNNYIPRSDIINDLTTGGIDKPISAEQGKTLANTQFIATGLTDPNDNPAPDWKARSGTYSEAGGGATNLLIHFKGGEGKSTPAFQLRTAFANGGLWYRTARDSVGFEKGFERIVTETSGNAPTANQLKTARQINNVSFDGTSDITVYDSTKLPTTGGDITGSLNVKNNLQVAGDHSANSLTSVSGVVRTDQYHYIDMGATYRDLMKLNNWGGSFAFIDSSNNSKVVCTINPQGVTAANFSGNLTGNADTATKLQNSRKINNVSFDGTSDITLTDDTKFIANGLTDPNDKPAPDWKAKSGTYSEAGGATNLIVQFKGGEGKSTPAFQLRTAFANGGLWYRTARDDAGFEKGFERIVTETSGNAPTANQLKTARQINSVSFDGTSDITIYDSTKLPTTGGDITGSLNVKNNLQVSGDHSANSLTSVSGVVRTDQYHYIDLGNSSQNTMRFTGWGANYAFIDASNSKTACTISPQGVTAANFSGNLTGNADTATKLQNSRKINNVIFDGTSDITLTDDTKFIATGLTDPNDKAAPDWKARSGTYSEAFGGATNLLIHFKGGEGKSTPALQLRTSFSNGGLWYRTARDSVGFEKGFERIVTETSGNAPTANQLKTARQINNVSFDGTSDITIYDSTKLPTTGGDITGSLNVKNNLQVSGDHSANSLTSVSGIVRTDQYHYIDMGATYRDLMKFNNWGGSFAFIDSSNNSKVVCTINPQGVTAANFSGNLTGNADTATKLQNSRKINNVSFDGTSDITLTDDTKFVANGLTDPNDKPAPDWRAKSGTYSEAGGATNLIVQFKGGEGKSTPAFQLRTAFANGGLWYRTARDNAGFEKGFERIVTETNGNAPTASQLKTARQINVSGSASGNAYFDGSSDITINLSSNDLDIVTFSPIAYPSSIAPSGYLAMMGQSISQSQYPKLYALYGSSLPDMRGYFIRGWDNGRGMDNGRNMLSTQGDAIRNIVGELDSGSADNQQLCDSLTESGALYVSQRGYKQWTADPRDGNNNIPRAIGFDASRVVPTANENRPSNIAFNYIVKAG
ncbi:phage tail protein [Acinetobacter nectaris]|uniref:phage tail-collar fiber domain-containing protein n=1 Tax=Acinetobacter nectaris TaxID=1219382 RepID=UPI001F1E3964|nr:phage tail protein [Acinetobacter nectaris]MCF9034710.1 phage tail protein [Acinetobacter nectaris]